MGFLSILFFRQICGIIIQGSQVTGWWMWLLEYRTSWCSRFWHVLFTETILIDPQIIRSVKSHRNNMSTKRTPTNRTQYRHDLICSDLEWMTFYCNQCRHVGNLIPKHVDPIQTYLHLKGFIRSQPSRSCRFWGDGEVETYDTHNIRDPLAAAVDPETGVVYVLVGYLAEVSSSVFDVLLVQRMLVASCDHLADHVHVSSCICIIYQDISG